MAIKPWQLYKFCHPFNYHRYLNRTILYAIPGFVSTTSILAIVEPGNL